jgi:hypothetical protein
MLGDGKLDGMGRHSPRGQRLFHVISRQVQRTKSGSCSGFGWGGQRAGTRPKRQARNRIYPAMSEGTVALFKQGDRQAKCAYAR